MNKSAKQQSGFTLVELMVSVAIIAIISVVTLANFHYAGQKGGVSMAAQKFSSDIRHVQNYSLSMKEYDDGCGPPTGSPDGGWGIYFNTVDPDEYIIYADKDNDIIYDGPVCNTKEMYKIIKFSDGVTISSMEAIPNAGPPNVAVSEGEITFLPPDPKINIRADGAAVYAEIKIVLSSSNNNYFKTVLINKFGLVDVDN